MRLQLMEASPGGANTFQVLFAAMRPSASQAQFLSKRRREERSLPATQNSTSPDHSSKRTLTTFLSSPNSPSPLNLHKKQSSLMTHLDVLSPRHHACCAASRAEAVSSYGWHPAAAGTGQTLERGSSWWPPSTPSRWTFFDSWRQRLKAETKRAPRRTSSLSRCGPTSSCLLLTRSSDDF